MKYKDLLKIYRNRDSVSDPDQKIAAALSPLPLENAGDLEKVIKSRFRYTGPGKWMKIIQES